jgi:serine/threonine-protein kinase HipA
MARTLDVYLHRDFAGHLVQDNAGQMMYQYAASWLDGRRAIPLSQSLPLRKERFSRNESRGFFGGILPEESEWTSCPSPWQAGFRHAHPLQKCRARV